MSVVFVQQEFLKKEQERKEAELLAEKQEASRKRKEEKRIAREVTNKSFFQIFYFISYNSVETHLLSSMFLRALRHLGNIL